MLLIHQEAAFSPLLRLGDKLIPKWQLIMALSPKKGCQPKLHFLFRLAELAGDLTMVKCFAI